MKDTAENTGNDMKDAVEDVGDNVYTATRTSTENTTNNGGNWMNGNMWTWIIVGIIAIIIVALVWYFVSKSNH